MENKQEKDLNPFEFTLEIDGKPHAVRVEVPKTGDYIIYINGERTGHIYPETRNNHLEWKTKDDLSQKLVNAIGLQIEILEANTLK